MIETKICSKCKVRKPISEFCKNRRRKNGLHSWCRKCSDEYSRKYRLSNPRRYWALHSLASHRQKGFVVNVTLDELDKLAKNTEYCVLCNVKLKWKLNIGYRSNSPTLDRKDNKKILTLENVWIICRKCNITKRDRTLKEFINYCKNIYLKRREVLK